MEFPAPQSDREGHEGRRDGGRRNEHDAADEQREKHRVSGAAAKSVTYDEREASGERDRLAPVSNQ